MYGHVLHPLRLLRAHFTVIALDKKLVRDFHHEKSNRLPCDVQFRESIPHRRSMHRRGRLCRQNRLVNQLALFIEACRGVYCRSSRMHTDCYVTKPRRNLDNYLMYIPRRARASAAPRVDLIIPCDRPRSNSTLRGLCTRNHL